MVVRVLLILALAAVIFWVFSIVDAAVQPPARHRGVSKPVWLVLVIVFPVVGGVLWLAVGRVSARQARVVAPDDDPDFLRRLGGSSPSRPSAGDTSASRRAQAEQDERIRQLEQELARLDDDDDPSHGSHRAH
ncbi:PLDc N-terminal domain-containing protein [Microbacterium horticulturae]|uniref:PLDc N-terminal domain-containing protein n=1 Tax=Microbacterium horticulturae TaxID=3028316 RepID=A0ABY8BZM0_9MICO|nr:PLDc N-terminal domain-containing protein [Microbacterium sp. KACC 23027]WEG09654.1 PLDc N-terminal domain-containing protein [Microbacterium sp. KACC 23027]